jgi:hypothetical protein
MEHSIHTTTIHTVIKHPQETETTDTSQKKTIPTEKWKPVTSITRNKWTVKAIQNWRAVFNIIAP